MRSQLDIHQSDVKATVGGTDFPQQIDFAANNAYCSDSGSQRTQTQSPLSN